jgi:hypothetical protein
LRFREGLPGIGFSQNKLPVFLGLVWDSGFLDLIPGSAVSGALLPCFGDAKAQARRW